MTKYLCEVERQVLISAGDVDDRSQTVSSRSFFRPDKQASNRAIGKPYACVRGITYPIERHDDGFLERWYVHNFLPRISQLQTTGLSALEIATEFNSRGITTSMNPRLWDAQHVLFVVRKDEFIRREDAVRRAEATFEHV
jgi:hypothetical protein